MGREALGWGEVAMTDTQKAVEDAYREGYDHGYQDAEGGYKSDSERGVRRYDGDVSTN
jgi:hypothetical protein